MRGRTNQGRTNPVSTPRAPSREQNIEKATVFDLRFRISTRNGTKPRVECHRNHRQMTHRRQLASYLLRIERHIRRSPSADHSMPLPNLRIVDSKGPCGSTADVVPRQRRVDEAENEGRGSGASGSCEGVGWAYVIPRS